MTSGDSLHKRGIPYPDKQGAADRDAGSFPVAADAVETGPDSGRSVLRQRYVSD